MLGWALATFVKGMKIRLLKNWLPILAERDNELSFERHYFVFYDGALTLNVKKWHLTHFAMKLLNCPNKLHQQSLSRPLISIEH